MRVCSYYLCHTYFIYTTGAVEILSGAAKELPIARYCARPVRRSRAPMPTIAEPKPTHPTTVFAIMLGSEKGDAGWFGPVTDKKYRSRSSRDVRGKS